MVKVNKNELKKILIDELNYKEHEADLYLLDYPDSIHDPLESSYKKWLSDRTVAVEPIEDLLISDIMNKRKAHFLMAIKILNRLFDKDLTESERTRLKEIIQKPSIDW